MKKMLTICMILGVLIGLAVIAAPKAPVATPMPATVVAPSSASTPDMKAEIESLVAEIKAAKEAGQIPNPALYARLAELQPRSEINPLDQGNDACPATVIPSIPYTDMGTTVGMVNDYSESCVYDGGAPDVIYEYTVVVTGDHTVSLCGSTFDTGLSVRTDGGCPGATEIACNDDYCVAQSQVTVNLTSGTTYYIIVDGYSDSSGDYILNVTGPTPPPPGDVCSTALPLPVPGSVTGTTIGYLNDYDFACNYTGSTAPDVVYWFEPIETELVQLTLCGVGSITNYDSKLYVYAGSCVNPPIACNDDACSTPYYSDYVSRLDCVPVTAGMIYFVVVDGYGSSAGNYTLDATICQPCPPPPNDDCVNAPILPVPGSVSGDNHCATPDCPSFPGQGNAWIAFEVPTNCNLVLDYCGSISHFGNAWLNLALGCPCTGYTAAGTYDWTTCSDGNVTIRWTGLTPGFYYYPVMRDDALNGAGLYTINVHCEVPPPCADFTLFAPGTLSGSTTGAGDNCTLNPGEEQMVEVHIPYTGMWIFSLCNPGTMYDTYLDLYSECCGGTLIASNDDYCGLVSELAHVPLDAGTYYLAIEGYGTATGPWELDVYACRARVDFDPTIIPQSVCVHVDDAMRTNLVIGGQPGQAPLDPTMPPIVTIEPGCHPDFTNCDDPDCPPYPGMIMLEWIFVADSIIMCDCGYPGCNCPPVIIHGGWFAWIINMDHMHGCVCITLEGFLPVELSSFTATPRDGAVVLAWTTVSETDNLRFDIVRDEETVARVEATRNASGSSYSWTDRYVTNGTTYTYTLVGVDINGQRTNLATESATPSFGSAVITEYALHQNFPNPFNPETQIAYDLVDNGLVSLRVYNLMGQEVAVLVNGMKDAGRHTISFDATSLPSGIYVYTLKANGFTAQKKMVLMK